ncbi:MAG: hypothetical protein HYX47_24035 [Burkholderiales bacterium]|nr:hypothetical protein [Burkholderiales bacterium]
MTKTPLVTIIFIALSAALAPAAAQNTYRCGDTYSQQPCVGGKVVAVEDARTGAQKTQSEAAARRDAKSADALGKERLTQEGTAAKSGPAQPVVASAPQQAASKPVMVKPKKPPYFTAVAPLKPGEKKPARKKKKKAAAKEGA